MSLTDLHFRIGCCREQKLARQSSTVEQAAREYRRRHGRDPPKGFDKWFEFAQSNGVVLVDEFDSTFEHVLPFHSLPRAILQERADELRRDPNTFTMVVRSGEIEIVGAHKDDGRAQDQANLMRRWTRFVPDFSMTMSAHDGPSVILNHKMKERHIAAARARERELGGSAAVAGRLWLIRHFRRREQGGGERRRVRRSVGGYHVADWYSAGN